MAQQIQGSISLPLNTTTTQPAGNQSGLGRWPTAGPVADPGASRLTIGTSPSVIGYPADRATQFGTSGAMASPSIPQDPSWSQHSPNANPNPGALSGGGSVAANQVSPNANPNPGAL